MSEEDNEENRVQSIQQALDRAVMTGVISARQEEIVRLLSTDVAVFTEKVFEHLTEKERHVGLSMASLALLKYMSLENLGTLDTVRTPEATDG